MGLVGPGAVREQPKIAASSLDGATGQEYVTILNPLSDDFAVMVGQSRPVNLPFQIRKDGNTDVTSNTEQDVQRAYGITLKNRDHTGVTHITNTTIILSGQTKNFLGNEAQVAVRQLVNEIMQREGNQKLLSDPYLRKEVEDRIIIKRGTVNELMLGDNPISQQQQVIDALNRSNEVAHEEVQFPGLGNTKVGEANGDRGGETSHTPADNKTGTTESSTGKRAK